MARYYRRRTYTRVVRPKKKWASNYVELSANPASGTNGVYYYQKELAVNSSEANTPTPVVIKTGNFRLQFDLTLTVAASGAVTGRAYIVYVPQGWNFGTTGQEMYNNYLNIVKQHPEWIMAWKQLDFGNANAAGSVDTSIVRMSSRLKRNLNSGDSVIFLLLGTGDFTGIDFRSTIVGACQFWTCAN